MQRFRTLALAVGALAVLAVTVASQPPGGQDQPGKKKKGPGGPPPRFELGKLFPPGLQEELQLTQEQRKALTDLEKDVKRRLEKLLTPEQQQKVREFRPRPPGQGPGDGPPQPGKKGGQPGGPPGPSGAARGDEPLAGIQWFGTWEGGLREARRSGRPILLVSAAPHCAGVSGTW